MQYIRVVKNKLSDKELIISKNSKYFRKKDPGMNKCFICHDRGHFANLCRISKRAKSLAQTSEKTMASQFLVKDEAHCGLHPDPKNILESSFNKEKRTSEDVFINGQPQPFIS